MDIMAEDENAEWTKILLTNVNEYGIIEPWNRKGGVDFKWLICY